MACHTQRFMHVHEQSPTQCAVHPQAPTSMDTDNPSADASVGPIDISAGVLPELEVYVILLVLMLETDSHQYNEVCPSMQIWCSGPDLFYFCWLNVRLVAHVSQTSSLKSEAMQLQHARGFT